MLQSAVKCDAGLKIPLYVQLYDHFKNEIISGRLEPHVRLPSIRQLAEGLNMSRTTIESAYNQLWVEGYIYSVPKVGYFISAIEANKFSGDNYDNPCTGGARQEKEERVKYDFGSDHIDKDSFDFLVWKKYINRALKDNDKFFSYGSYQGEFELRKEITRYLSASRGVICGPDQVIIGAGVQNLLSILCGILKKSYDSIGFEEPGFKKGQRIFKDHDFKITPIRLEKDGIDIKMLAASDTKVVYVSPSHQFPTGSTMPVGKRVQLLNWAHVKEGLIIEDDYDSELRYFGRPIPSLQGLNKGANVIYLGSFSKILLPSLRISYMVLPASLLEIAKIELTQYNQTSSKIEQIALSLFMKDGMLEKHVRKLRKIYARKNQALTESIQTIMKDKVEIMGNETGLHILLEVKTGLSAEQLERLAEEAGVKVVPVSHYFIEKNDNKHPHVLLSYGGITAENIGPAVRLLQQAWF